MDKMNTAVWYKIERSRNNGKFWCHLVGLYTPNYATIKKFFDLEVTNHPSDWLRIVKIEESPIEEHLGNKKMNK